MAGTIRLRDEENPNGRSTNWQFWRRGSQNPRATTDTEMQNMPDEGDGADVNDGVANNEDALMQNPDLFNQYITSQSMMIPAPKRSTNNDLTYECNVIFTDMLIKKKAFHDIAMSVYAAHIDGAPSDDQKARFKEDLEAANTFKFCSLTDPELSIQQINGAISQEHGGYVKEFSTYSGNYHQFTTFMIAYPSKKNQQFSIHKVTIVSTKDAACGKGFNKVFIENHFAHGRYEAITKEEIKATFTYELMRLQKSTSTDEPEVDIQFDSRAARWNTLVVMTALETFTSLINQKGFKFINTRIKNKQYFRFTTGRIFESVWDRLDQTNIFLRNVRPVEGEQTIISKIRNNSGTTQIYLKPMFEILRTRTLNDMSTMKGKEEVHDTAFFGLCTLVDIPKDATIVTSSIVIVVLFIIYLIYLIMKWKQSEIVQIAKNIAEGVTAFLVLFTYFAGCIMAVKNWNKKKKRELKLIATKEEPM